MRQYTYLEWTAGTGVETPVVVKVETDQTQYREVEQNVPTRYEAAIAVKSVAEVSGWCTLLGQCRRKEGIEDGGVVIAMPQFVCKQNTKIEDPCCTWNVSSR